LSKPSQWHHVECPHCNKKFRPQMRNFPLGLNKENKHIYVYYQICPSCDDSIVGIKVLKDGQSICNPNDSEDLVLLHHK
jgi:phage terminase large subunit GpA-like protein